ncbi:MAG: ribosome biogenesis factor YjgA [Pseudomonadales bacterium]
MSTAERRPGIDPVDTDEPISKSERKRRAHRLQALGRQLTELKRDDLAGLELSDKLRDAVLDYQRFTSHEARRRQLQFIGRLMRDLDPEPLQQALDTLHGQSAEARYEFHQVELWRKRLLEEPDSLTAFLDAFPNAESQPLRQRIAQVRNATSEIQQKTAFRSLFRFLRDVIHPA